MLPWSSSSLTMANNLIKWWRTKFLNGYKQFSVIQMDNNDSRLSDTEELLGNGSTNGHYVHGETTLPTCSTPPAPSNTNIHDDSRSVPRPSTPQNHPTTENKHLNLEEFSCDVSMEGGVYRDGQEFSFTLYDFDGHGKITKDDIAGLVTTIYETLGSSVKVPHYGSKTIKVKLTVSPDQRKRMSATVIDHKSPAHGSPSQSNNEPQQPQQQQQQQQQQNRTKEDSVNDNTYVKRHRQTQCRRQKRGRDGEREHICCNVDVSDAELDYSDHCSRVSEDEITEDEGECSEDQMPKHPSREKIKPRRYQKNAHFRHPAHFVPSAHVHPYSAPVLCTKARRNKKKSSSLQRKELLEIIQANMEKNNHGFQTTSRKQQSPAHVNNESEQTPPVEHKQHRYKHKVPYDSSDQLQCLTNIVNSENCYLDLATLQDETHVATNGQNLFKHVPFCRYDKLLGAVVCMSNNKVNCNLQKSQMASSPCRHKRHYRSRSHDLSQVPLRYNLLESQNNNVKNEVRENLNSSNSKKPTTKVKSCETSFEQPPTPFKKQVKKFPQIVLGHSSSPHHLKHRNRQEDQARAMAQVVRWLEQEFSSNVNVNVNKKPDTGKKKSNSRFSQSPRTSPSVSAGAVERHEHHHVHEHIHHHYHHYQEAPVVV